MRRAAAVLLLLTSLVLISLALMLNPGAASLAVSGSLLGALVVFLDVDKLIGGG